MCWNFKPTLFFSIQSIKLNIASDGNCMRKRNLNNWWYDHWKSACARVCVQINLTHTFHTGMQYARCTHRNVRVHVTVQWKSSLLLNDEIPISPRLYAKQRRKTRDIHAERLKNSQFCAGFAGLVHSSRQCVLILYSKSGIRCTYRVSGIKRYTNKRDMHYCNKTISFE